MSNHATCTYVGPNGETCEDSVECDGVCYWHSKSKKLEADLVARLEARAKSGRPMVGFSLRYANLEGLNLVRHGSKQGYHLVYSDLYRCNLTNAHLFNLDLTGSSLMKANLTMANLNCSCLLNTNLLGVKLKGVKLDNIEWDRFLRQETQAYETRGNRIAQIDYFEQAEEIYRNLRRTTESQGLFENAGRFFQREMIMRRYQLPRYGFTRFLSKMVDLFCGYGEEPVRVVSFSLIIILSFACIYFIAGVSDGGAIVEYAASASITENLLTFFQSLYFSVVTFTTLGYGDLSPVGITRAFAAIEAFVGSFTLALFVVVFVKKMTR
jgi:Uncharacterized low-complexity proteins